MQAAFQRGIVAQGHPPSWNVFRNANPSLADKLDAEMDDYYDKFIEAVDRTVVCSAFRRLISGLTQHNRSIRQWRNSRNRHRMVTGMCFRLTWYGRLLTFVVSRDESMTFTVGVAVKIKERIDLFDIVIPVVVARDSDQRWQI